MPAYKTHSIHGEIIYPNIQEQIKINLEDLKLYCMGPDALIATDYKTFNKQHEENVKDFFIKLIYLIKDNNLQYNSEVMAYLYGQIDHLALDSITHPLIYYLTENMEKEFKMNPHGLGECYIDEYIMKKYNKSQKNYYLKRSIKDKELIKLLDKVYENIFDIKNGGNKYSYGIYSTYMFDKIRNDKHGIASFITNKTNVGNLTYDGNITKAFPYLNLEHDIWYNPETNQRHTESFDDLWYLASKVSLDTIKDVNDFLYFDKPLTNSLILNDTSYNTGLSCDRGQTLKYVKKYKKEINI